MNTILYIATSIGLFIVAQTNGSWDVIRHSLQDHSLTSVAASNEYIIVGTRDGLWRSSDNGSTWQKVGGKAHAIHIRWLMASKTQPQTVFAGTEPAGILKSRDGGLNWVNSADVEKMRDAMEWFLPYSPEAGCVRGFAFAETTDSNGINQIYAAVEVGGVLVSSDGGKNWQLVKGSDGSPDFSRDLGSLIHPDVHSISVHPEAPETLTASTGGGLYRSADGGKTWKNIYDAYIRAAWVDPDDPLHIISGPAAGVARNGRIERSVDGGKTWHLFSEGMKSPWARHMVDRFVENGGTLYAILSNGEIWQKPSNREKWSRILADIGHVEAMAVP